MTDAAVCRYCLEAEGLICGQVGVAPKLFSPGLMLVDPLGRPFMNGYKTSKHGCFICFFYQQCFKRWNEQNSSARSVPVVVPLEPTAIAW